ncbi:Conserved_hypothetical protein [Hexamita inflata]|uniref:Ankyrin repeat-containing protein n=1 Tax=Hexamita inflata TaxID=28002 RepID=A0AA86U508_9EUKA|nr:Conserved hypothetical protein [Hexamita inflata]
MKCQSDFTWFDACSKNDLTRVQKLKAKHLYTRDPRPEYHSFTGLFHAAHNDAEAVFQYLFQLEFSFNLSYDVIVSAPGISDTAKYKLSAESSVAHLILLRNSLKCYNIYVNYVRMNKCIKQQQNAFGITPLHISAVISRPLGLEYVHQLDLVLADLDSVACDGMTFLMYVCYFGRHEIFFFLMDLLRESNAFQKQFVFAHQADIQRAAVLKQLKEKLVKQFYLKDLNNSDVDVYARSEVQNQKKMGVHSWEKIEISAKIKAFMELLE